MISVQILSAGLTGACVYRRGVVVVVFHSRRRAVKRFVEETVLSLGAS